MRIAATVLVVLGIADVAWGQNAQSAMLSQTVAAVTNPKAAWQASFSPNMISRLRPVEVQSLSPNCRAVVVGVDKRPVSTAGLTLVAGTLCIKTSRQGLTKRVGHGLANQTSPQGIDTGGLKGGLADPVATDTAAVPVVSEASDPASQADSAPYGANGVQPSGQP